MQHDYRLTHKLFFYKALACIGVICDYITKSPKHLDDSHVNRRTLMNTQISTKLAALAVALVMNSLLIGGVAYLFNGQLHQHTAIISLAHTAVSTLTGAV
jgi:hypothetical protein